MNLVLISTLVVLTLCVLGLFLGSGSARNAPKELADPAFNRVYGAHSPQPKLDVSSSYGYPAFEVIFSSKAEMEGAAHLNAAFKHEINALFRSWGAWDRPFNADLAIFFTYPGHIQELIVNGRQGNSPDEAKSGQPHPNQTFDPPI